MRIAASAGEATDPAERLAKIVDVLGKAGLKLAPGLNAGAKAMADLRDETSKLSKEEVEALEKAGQALESFYTKTKVLAGEALNAAIAAGTAKATQTQMGSAYMGMGGTLTAGQFKHAVENAPNPPAEAAPHLTDEDRAAKTRTEILGAKSDFVPVDPSRAKGIEEDAKKATEEVFNQLHATQALGDYQDEQTQREKDDAKEIAKLHREADDSERANAATLAGHASKRLELEKQSALLAKQIADLRSDAAAETDDVKRAGIEKEIVGLQNQQRLGARERLDLETKITEAQSEAADAATRNEIARLNGLGIAGQKLALELHESLLQAEIERNVEAAKNADELRTLELQKQNIELAGQIQALVEIRRQQFINENMAGPAATLDKKRDDAKRAGLGRQFDRMEDLKARGGRSKADIANDAENDKFFRDIHEGNNRRLGDTDPLASTSKTPRSKADIANENENDKFFRDAHERKREPGALDPRDHRANDPGDIAGRANGLKDSTPTQKVEPLNKDDLGEMEKSLKEIKGSTANIAKHYGKTI
jgi:hypothetical protein